MELKISKYLKGQSGPIVRHITFLDHQGFQLDPPVRHVTFLDHQGGPLDLPVRHITFLDHQVMETLRFWIIKLGPPMSDVTFSHHLMTRPRTFRWTQWWWMMIYISCWCGVSLFICHVSSSSNVFPIWFKFSSFSQFFFFNFLTFFDFYQTQVRS